MISDGVISSPFDVTKTQGLEDFIDKKDEYQRDIILVPLIQ